MLCSLRFTVSHSVSLISHLKSQFLREVFPLVPAPVPVFCSPGPCSILFVAFIPMRSCAIYAFVSLALLEWEPPPPRWILRATAVPSADGFLKIATNLQCNNIYSLRTTALHYALSQKYCNISVFCLDCIDKMNLYQAFYGWERGQVSPPD